MKASELTSFESVSTGFTNLDKLTGVGGIPFKKITELSGQFSVGKSTIALSLVAQAQAEGKETLWVDTEWAFETEYAKTLGVQLDSLDVIQEQFAENALDETVEWIDTHKNGVVVLDSVGGLLPRSEAEKNSDGKVIGAQAKLIATFCRKVVPMLAINNIALLILNHEFTDLMTGRLMTSGGAKLGYHKSLWLRLRKGNKRVMKGDQQVGEVIIAEVRKNKLAPTNKQSCELTMVYGEGFNKDADLIEAAKEKLFEKRGQFFYWNDEKIARGEAGLRELFKDESFAAKIKHELGK